MNNNLRAENLVRFDKTQLLAMITEAVDYTTDNDGDDYLHEALQQIEAVTYVLNNCDYEGKE